MEIFMLIWNCWIFFFYRDSVAALREISNDGKRDWIVNSHLCLGSHNDYNKICMIELRKSKR